MNVKNNPKKSKQNSTGFVKEKSKKYIDKEEDNGTGGKVKVRYYRDGTSTVFWGGPAGEQFFDEYGNS